MGRYSGVRRQQDFPPLTSSKGAYQPPGKRAPVERSTSDRASADRAPSAAPVAAPSDRGLVDSAIMFAGAKADKPSDKVKPAAASKATKPEVATPPTTTESSTTPTPELKNTAAPSAGRTVPPPVKTTGGPNATATVEVDVSKAFKSFAANQRTSVQQHRMNKAKNDKQIKLNDLKKFANDFKLNTPVPQDLVPIIAKDPAKQKAIQEKAQRNAEEAKLHPTDSVKPITPGTDANTAQRSATTTTTHTASPPSGTPSRQTANRGPYPQGTHSFQNSRGDRPVQAEQSMPRSGTAGHLSQRLRSLEQNRPVQVPSNMMPPHEARLPPTGPSNPVDPNFSRRSSGVASAQGGPRLNASVSEFRPNAFAKDFSPAGNPSSGSSPRSMAPEAQSTPPIARSLIRRTPLAKGARPSLKGKYEAMELIKTYKPGEGKNWAYNGGLKPAYETNLLWKLPSNNDGPTESYVQYFEKAPFPTTTPVVSEPHPPQTAPQVPHQHQLPFHLQSGVHNINARQSPRQPQINMHGAQMGHPGPAFSGPDELRMMPSHSAQSFSSPRMQQLPMAFHSPMGGNAQLAYNPQMVPYPGAPQMQPFRSLSQTHQFMPQGHMGQPVMIPNPAGGFMPPQGMAPGPQMMYPPGAQGQFMPPNNGHPPVMPNGGYPSPSRGAPMMMSQGSSQGHQPPMFGMSPGPQYGTPVFPQQIPGQSKFKISQIIAIDSNISIVPMRGGFGGPTPYGTSPQHQGGPRNQYNPNLPNFEAGKPYRHNQHNNGPSNNQVPTGPQAQVNAGADESK